MPAVFDPAKRLLAALLLAVLLVWLLATSVATLVAEVAGRKQPYSYRLFAPEEDRIRDELGADYEILTTLRELVPEDGLVVATARAEEGRMLRLRKLRNLLYPLFVVRPDKAVETFSAGGFEVGPQVFVLDLDPGSRDHWQPTRSQMLDPVVTRDRFQLWRGRKPQR